MQTGEEEEGWKVEVKLREEQRGGKRWREGKGRGEKHGAGRRSASVSARGPWVTGLSPAGHLPTAKLLPSVATRCHTHTHTHAENHPLKQRTTHTLRTHLAVSVVRIAAESCEAKTLIKTTDHFLQERERRRGRRGVI